MDADFVGPLVFDSIFHPISNIIQFNQRTAIAREGILCFSDCTINLVHNNRDKGDAEIQIRAKLKLPHHAAGLHHEAGMRDHRHPLRIRGNQLSFQILQLHRPEHNPVQTEHFRRASALHLGRDHVKQVQNAQTGTALYAQ